MKFNGPIGQVLRTSAEQCADNVKREGDHFGTCDGCEQPAKVYILTGFCGRCTIRDYQEYENRDGATSEIIVDALNGVGLYGDKIHWQVRLHRGLLAEFWHLETEALMGSVVPCR